MRRAQDKIRELVKRLRAANDEEEQIGTVVELRTTLHHYVESLRARLAAYPNAKERRIQDGPPAGSDDSASKKGPEAL